MYGSSYVRPFSETTTLSLYPNFGSRGYRNQVLSHFESALMIASHIEPGGGGPELHYHKVDQIYFLLHGGTNVQLGHETFFADAGSLVFIPAGLAHRNWNDGSETESHFEIIAPTPRPSVAIVYPVSSPDDVPLEDRSGRVGIVKHPDGDDFLEPVSGFRMIPLIGPNDGSANIILNLAEVDPGKGRPGTHVHDFDQYYLVLDGDLTVEIGLRTEVVGRETLVTIPAGVPHRMYNAGNVLERHLVMIAPPPAENSGPWDIGVDFAPNGVSFDPAVAR